MVQRIGNTGTQELTIVSALARTSAVVGVVGTLPIVVAAGVGTVVVVVVVVAVVVVVVPVGHRCIAHRTSVVGGARRCWHWRKITPVSTSNVVVVMSQKKKQQRISKQKKDPKKTLLV